MRIRYQLAFELELNSYSTVFDLAKEAAKQIYDLNINNPNFFQCYQKTIGFGLIYKDRIVAINCKNTKISEILIRNANKNKLETTSIGNDVSIGFIFVYKASDTVFYWDDVGLEKDKNLSLPRIIVGIADLKVEMKKKEKIRKKLRMETN